MKNCPVAHPADQKSNQDQPEHGQVSYEGMLHITVPDFFFFINPCATQTNGYLFSAPDAGNYTLCKLSRMDL